MSSATNLANLTKIPIELIKRAQNNIAKVAIRTPTVKYNSTDTTLPNIHLKLENFQTTGAFKLRGAYNAVSSLEDHLLKEGVFTTSTGNFAQGLAYTCMLRGIPCTVVCPDTAPEVKTRAAEKFHAKIKKVKKDEFWEAMFSKFYDLPGTFIHPCCNIQVIAGYGTTGLEILEDVHNVDAVVIPYGGGSLTTGIASAIKASRPEVKIFACEIDVAAPLTASVKAGKPTVLEQHKTTFVDGMSGTTIFPDMWPMVKNLVDDVLVLTEDEIADAVQTILYSNKILVEGAAAATVAAVLRHKHKFAECDNVVCVMSGGNLDRSVLSNILKRM